MTSNEQLTQKKCQPCEGMGKPLTKDEATKRLSQIPGWQVDTSGKLLFREFIMKNFLAAVRLISEIAKVAEAENHHPDLHLTGYRKLKVDLSTHTIGGISENDFILAAKINQLPAELKQL